MSKIDDAMSIIEQLGFPRPQRNERSALCLLALLHLKEDMPWAAAAAPLIGITPIMDFVRDHYGRHYAPNTRETFRRQTMHQFVEAGLALYNPDLPARPVNSPKAVYQIEPAALTLLRGFGAPAWADKLEAYRAGRPSLVERYAKRRQLQMVPVLLEDREIYLSPGKHSQLIKQIIEEFAPRFAPGAVLIYAGDTGSKAGYFNEAKLAELGVSVDKRGKLPDVILYYPQKHWLLLIEAVTSHGPVDPKRHGELASLFRDSSAGLVYVTAFASKSVMARYVAEISWETEVWIAETPTHLIHFDGQRFLGPYAEE